MASAEHLCEVEILETHFCHYARIGKNKTLFGLRKNDSEARFLGGKFLNGRYVYAAFPKAFEAQFAERIVADR